MEERNYICAGQTFTYSKGYIGLPVEIDGLPESVSIGDEMLRRKSGFHVSLVCVKNIVGKNGVTEEKVITSFCSFVKEHDIAFLEYSGEFRFARSGEKRTLVALCNVSNLKEFSDSLGKEFGMEIPPQPTHVTLYTLQPDVGIGLNTPEDMARETVSVQVSEEIRGCLGLA